jgi:hypothetical protein
MFFFALTKSKSYYYIEWATMNQLTKTLEAISNNATIGAEFDSIKKGARNSATFNTFIKVSYPKLFEGEWKAVKSSKVMLLRVWSEVIGKAARPRNDASISRTYIRLFEALDPVVKRMYPNENTAETVFVEFRKPVRERFGDGSEVYKQSTYLLGVSRERAIERREEYANRVAQKGLTRRDLKPIYDDEVYRAIDEGFASVDPLENVIAVMLATSSRFIEVLKVSNYSVVSQKAEEPYEIKPAGLGEFIRIQGIAKDRANRGYENKVVIRGLVRLSAKQVIDKVKHIRESLNVTGTNSEVSGRYNSTANKKVKRLFPDHPGLTTHKMRYISANMAYLLYGAGGVENTFIQQHLGHEDGSVSRTYQSINLRLRSAPDPVSGSNRIDAQFSELKGDFGEFKVNNAVEHESIREQIDEKVPVGESGPKKRNQRSAYASITKADYAGLVNPPQRTTQEKKFKLLDSIFYKYKRRNILPKQNDLKKHYKFGSNTITEYYKARGL